MKQLHRPDLWCWSVFDPPRNVDFHGYAWTRPGGAVLIDPMPMGSHDLAHLASLGGVAEILLTNSDHTRASLDLQRIFGAPIRAPSAEREGCPIAVQGWLGEGDEPVPGLRVLELHGSKTPGELALLLEGHTLFTGDLVRAHRAGALMLLPEAKLADPAAARHSLRRLAELPQVEAVLVGDGWPVFREGGALLRALAESLA